MKEHKLCTKCRSTDENLWVIWNDVVFCAPCFIRTQAKSRAMAAGAPDNDGGLLIEDV